MDQSSISAGLITANVPDFLGFQPQTDDEDQVLERIEEISRQDKYAKDKGILAVHGDSGVGKTTLISQLIIRHCNFLKNNCGFSFVLWLNCAKWSPDSFDEECLITALIETSEQGSGFKEIFSSIAKANFYYECKKVKVLLVLDHVSNQNILKMVLEKCPSFYCLVVTNDLDLITKSINTDPFSNHFDDETIYDILKNKHKLNLSELQLRNLAKQCRGRPLLVDRLASQFQKCKTKRQISVHYISTINSLQLENGKQFLVEDNNEDCGLNSSSLELKMKTYKCENVGNERIFKLWKRTFNFDAKLSEKERKRYLAILLFHPTEPISIEHLAVLWNCDLNEAEVECCKLSHLELMQFYKGEMMNDGYIVHEFLYQSCLEYAITSKIGTSLTEVRTELVTDFTGNDSKLLEFLLLCIEDEQWQLIETIFKNCDEKLLANVCMMPVDNGKWSFIHKLYKTGWSYPISDESSRKRTCCSMIKRFQRYEKITKNRSN